MALVWFGVWFGFWITFNVFRAKKETNFFSLKGRLVRAILFLFATVLASSIFCCYPPGLVGQLFLISLVVIPVGLFANKFQSRLLHKENIKPDFWITLPFNLLFQQTMILAVVFMLSGSSFINKDLVAGSMFFVAHAPIVFCQWVRFRYVYLVLTFFGGVMFSLLIRNLDFGYIYAYLTHFAFYLGLVWFVRGEEEI